MKPLEKNFIGFGEVKGYKFTQISKTDKAFIYEVSSGGSKHYEVFKRIVNKRFVCESYPTSNAFGIWAWTYMSLEATTNKFYKLNK
jgi:hypothetical protein